MSTADTYPSRAPTEVCWEEIAHDDHSVQIYADSQSFLDALEGFVSGGLRQDETVVVIVTETHRVGLERKLARRGYDVKQAKLEGRLIVVSATTTLGVICEEGKLNYENFQAWVTDLMHLAGSSGRRVRTFGEMTSLIWEQGHHATSIELEAIWEGLCQRENVRVFCAYPRSAFTDEHIGSLQTICAHHSRVIPE